MKKHSTLLLMTLLFLVLSPAQLVMASDISRITMTFYDDPATKRGFTWYTPEGGRNSHLQVVAATDSAPPDFSLAQTFTGYQGASTYSSGYWHKAAASGLTPSARYYYRVGDAQLNIWSNTGSFDTAPLQHQPFSFICITDSQTDSLQGAQIVANTINAACQIAPEAAFIIHSGDVVENGNIEAQWQTVLDSAQSNLLHKTIVPAAGNHDRHAQAFTEHFCLFQPEGSATQSGVYYSFDYGDIHVTTLNTNENSSAYANFSQHQIDWLTKDIADARANGSKRVVVNMHKGPYSTGPYAMAGDIIGSNGERTKIAPLFTSLDVDLVLQGHDHYGSRTKPLFDGAPTKYGVTYLNTGTSGPKGYQFNSALKQPYLELFDWWNPTAPVWMRYQNFCIIQVDANANMTGTLYEIDQKGDPATPYVIDQFYLPTTSAQAGETPFRDISAADPFYNAVKNAYSQGFISGTSAQAFSPDSPVTRAMAAAILYQLNTAKAPDGNPHYTANFTDISADEWFSQSVAWAAGNGIMTGYGDGRFDPYQHITTEQFLNAAHQYCTYLNAESQWQVLLETPILKELLHPQNKLTRAQIAEVLLALQQLQEENTQAVYKYSALASVCLVSSSCSRIMQYPIHINRC